MSACNSILATIPPSSSMDQIVDTTGHGRQPESLQVGKSYARLEDICSLPQARKIYAGRPRLLQVLKLYVSFKYMQAGRAAYENWSRITQGEDGRTGWRRITYCSPGSFAAVSS